MSIKHRLAVLAALSLCSAPALAQAPSTTQPGIGMILSPCSANVPVVGNGASVLTKCHASGALGSAAFANTGTSGGTLPLLNGTNTWSAVQTFSSAPAFNALPTGTAVATASTASTLVARDGSGNFSAGTITASLTGLASLDLALTGGTMSGAIAMGTNAITGLTTLAGAGALTFQTNGSIFAGNVTTGQQWFFGTTSNAPPSGPILTVSKNASVLSALGTPPGVSGPTQVIATFGAVDGSNGDVILQAFGGSANVRYFTSNGTAASRTATTIGQGFAANFAYGFDGTNYVAAAGFNMVATNNYSGGTTTGGRLDIYATPAGTAGIAVGASVGAGFMVGTTTDPGIGSMTLTGNIQSRGTSPTGNTGTCTASSFTGGATAGKFSAAVCAGGTFILSALPTAPNGYTCDAQDQTTPADTLKQTANTTTSVTFTSTTVASDVIAFKCIAW